MLDFGVLGMNARNISYIGKFNDRKGIRLANDKQRTKRFLQARGIPVPTTFDVIKTYEDLWSYDFSQLPVDEFIIKPAKGSRGRGIYRVKFLGENYEDETSIFSPSVVLSPFEKLFSKQSPYAHHKYKISGKIIDDATFRRYLLDIIYGKSSMEVSKDSVIIEELLVPGGGFERYCEKGLADIRMIVFNMIPIATMLRVPTDASDGKANLDRGALGMGVEVGSGKIYGMYQFGEIHRDKFPSPYESFAHQTLPYWDEILSYSSKIQYFSKLGYLALDWVVTQDGPKLLEMNARAGLKFQLATQLPVKKRLEKVADLKVVTPEKGVEISKTLFSHHKSQAVSSSKLLYLTQHGAIVSYFDEKEKEEIDVIVEVDLSKKRNYCSADVFAHLDGGKGNKLSLAQGITFTDIPRKKSENREKNRVVLGRETVAEFYVKPIHKIFTKLDFINPKNIQKGEIDDIHILDQRVDKISKILNTSRILRPINFLEELDTFITWNGKYNPHFQYRRPSDKKLGQVEDELLEIQEKYFGTSALQSKFAQLFRGKIDELFKKLILIQSYKKQNTKKIIRANISLFGRLDDELVGISQEKFFRSNMQDRDVLGEILPREEVYKIIRTYVDERGIQNVKIKFDADLMGRMSIKRGKTLTIRVSESGGFREKELLATLAHEVDVHVKRHQAGFATGRRLLQAGTGGYIRDEEGLAILASDEHMPDDYEKLGMYQKYYLMSIAGDKTFSEIVGIIRSMTNKTLLGAFKGALRLKKGLSDTSNRGGAVYMKDKIYLEGYTLVKKRLEDGGNKDDLMIGKIKIADLPYIK